MKFTFVPPFPGLSPSDDITRWSGPAWLTGLHQPPRAEDLPVQRPAHSFRISSPHSGWLGDPQGPERQALLLQPRHRRTYLEAAAHPRHRRQRQKRQPGRDGERGERVWRIPQINLRMRMSISGGEFASMMQSHKCYIYSDTKKMTGKWSTLYNCGDVLFIVSCYFFKKKKKWINILIISWHCEPEGSYS